MYDYQANRITTATVDGSVHVAVPPEITTTSLPDGKVGHYYEATLEATGGQPPYTWSATGLPAGLTCSAVGVISGTPTAVGDFTVGVGVTDDNAVAGCNNLALKVYPVLEIITTNIPEAKVGDYYEATLEATGGKPPLTWEATGLPAGLSCSTTGVISGTTTETGDFTVTVTVTDSFSIPDTDQKVLTLWVSSLRIITTSLPEVRVGDAYSTALAATGGNHPYTWGVAGLPTGLTCSATGLISGTPTASGDFTVTVTVTDSSDPVGTDITDLALKVYGALQITTISLTEAKVGHYYEATLEATGGKPPHTWEATGLPAGLTYSTAGVISGTPTAFGDFTVTVTVTDSFSPASADITDLALKVYAALEIATTTLPEAKVGDYYEATLEATGGKPPLTWEVTGLPSGLTCSAAGVITGTATEIGDFAVAVSVTDSFDPVGTDTTDLALKVLYSPLEIATTSFPEGQVGEVYAVSLAATGGKPPYTWGVAGLPAGLICSTAGLIPGTPTASGDFTVTVTVTDSFKPVNAAIAELTLKVYAVLQIATASLPDANAGDAYTATLAVTGGKPPLTWEATGLPAGLTCCPAGVISGTATEVGDFTIRVSVNDGLARSDSVELSMRVSCKPGDVNVDCVVDTGDITKVKRIYFGLDGPTPCADVNEDGFIDTGDITAIKVIYFGA